MDWLGINRHLSEDDEAVKDLMNSREDRIPRRTQAIAEQDVQMTEEQTR